jgi:hypothetical protein
MFENLKGDKGYLDNYELGLYMETVDDFNHLANQAEYVMKQMLNGIVSPFDEMD